MGYNASRQREGSRETGRDGLNDLQKKEVPHRVIKVSLKSIRKLPLGLKIKGYDRSGMYFN